MSGSRVRARIRLLRHRARARAALARMGVAIARRQVEEIWIGDSHAVLLNTAQFPVSIARAGSGRYVWHLGPRLMYSIAHGDFPVITRRAAAAFAKLPATPDVRYVFCLGEIDVRCHLAPRLDDPLDPAFVTDYLTRVRSLVARLGADSAVVVVPPPPSDEIRDLQAFPTTGTIEERVRAHTWLRAALRDALRAEQTGPTLRLLDPTDAFADPQGRLRSEFTDDGCHTNERGRQVLRAEFRELAQGPSVT